MQFMSHSSKPTRKERSSEKHNFKPVVVSTFLEPQTDFYATTDNSRRTNKDEKTTTRSNDLIDELNKASFEIKINKVSQKKSRESTITNAFAKGRSKSILNTTNKKAVRQSVAISPTSKLIANMDKKRPSLQNYLTTTGTR